MASWNSEFLKAGVAHALFPLKLSFCLYKKASWPACRDPARITGISASKSAFSYKHNGNTKKKQGMSRASMANRAGSPSVNRP